MISSGYFVENGIVEREEALDDVTENIIRCEVKITRKKNISDMKINKYSISCLKGEKASGE
jgi:hypothetical protein